MKSLNELIWSDEDFNLGNGDGATFNGDEAMVALCGGGGGGGGGVPCGCFSVLSC